MIFILDYLLIFILDKWYNNWINYFRLFRFSTTLTNANNNAPLFYKWNNTWTFSSRKYGGWVFSSKRLNRNTKACWSAIECACMKIWTNNDRFPIVLLTGGGGWASATCPQNESMGNASEKIKVHIVIAKDDG